MIQQLYPSPNHSFRFELNKDMNVSAAHYIDDPAAGKCRQVHGHTYFINITIGGNELNSAGFLVDFKQLKRAVHDRFDHSVLNEDEVFANQQPSTERLAEVIYDIVTVVLKGLHNQPKCLQVFVRETPTSYVIFRPRGEENV